MGKEEEYEEPKSIGTAPYGSACIDGLGGGCGCIPY